MIPKTSKIGLVTPPAREEEAVKRLGRIGYSVSGCGQSADAARVYLMYCVRV